MPSPQKKYTTLVSNTLLFAISNFSSKLLSFFIRPYLSYALDSPDVMGVSSLLQQATNLLIPVVSLGVAYAVIRFGLDKATNKSSVFVNGAATIGLGFVVLLLAMPLVRLIPNAAEYLGFLYLCVLASCMRTLCTQFIRSRMLNRLVAIDGVLTTLSLLLYYLLFLSVLKMGAAGFLLANALADLTSMVFVFIAGGCWRYFKPKAFDKAHHNGRSATFVTEHLHGRHIDLGFTERGSNLHDSSRFVHITDNKRTALSAEIHINPV